MIKKQKKKKKSRQSDGEEEPPRSCWWSTRRSNYSVLNFWSGLDTKSGERWTTRERERSLECQTSRPAKSSANLLQSLPSDLIDDSQSSSFQFPLSILYSQQQPSLTCSYVQQRRQWLWRDRPGWDSEFSRRSVGLDRESFVQGKPLSPSCSSTTASANKKSFPELNQWIIAECVSFWWWWWWPIYRSHVDCGLNCQDVGWGKLNWPSMRHFANE